MEKHIASARNPFRQFREIPQILLQNRESLRKFSIFPQQTLTIEADPLRMTAAIIAGSVFFAAGAACVKYRKVYW